MTTESKAAVIIVACVLVLALYGKSTEEGSGGSLQEAGSKTERRAVIVKADGKARPEMIDDLEYFKSNKVDVIGRVNRAIADKDIEEIRRLDNCYGFIDDSDLQEAIARSRKVVESQEPKIR